MISNLWHLETESWKNKWVFTYVNIIRQMLICWNSSQNPYKKIWISTLGEFKEQSFRAGTQWVGMKESNQNWRNYWHFGDQAIDQVGMSLNIIKIFRAMISHWAFLGWRLDYCSSLITSHDFPFLLLGRSFSDRDILVCLWDWNYLTLDISENYVVLDLVNER